MNYFRILVLAMTMAVSAFGQMSANGSPVIVSDAPPRDFYTRVFYVSSGDIYTCVTSSIQTVQYTMTLTSTVGGATTSLVFSAGHGIHPDASPKFTITGGTGTWVAANATWKATYVNSTTFTIALDSSGLGAVAGTLVVKSSAPRLTQPVWAVSRYHPSGADPSSTLWSSDGWNSVCSNYATLSYQ